MLETEDNSNGLSQRMKCDMQCRHKSSISSPISALYADMRVLFHLTETKHTSKIAVDTVIRLSRRPYRLFQAYDV